MPTLSLVRGGRPIHAVEVGPAVHVGRAPTNELVLTDPFVSSHHCVLWVEAGELWVEDLGSANGTWVDGARVEGPVRVAVGSRIALAPESDLYLLVEGAAPGIDAPCWMVEDLDAGVRLAVRADRFVIGSAPRADLRLPSGPEVAATLLVDATEVWLGVGEEERPVAPGVPFEVGGRSFVVVAPSEGRRATVRVDPARYDYRVEACLDNPLPTASVEDRQSGSRFEARGDNRAILLYLLARQLARDRQARRDLPETWGWVEDEALVRGIWGRQRPADEVNSVNVLLHRIRRGVRRKGLDPWFIEKRQRAVRMRVAEVVAVPP